MIGYVTVGTNDVERARGFYDALLAEIGGKRLQQLEEGGFTLYGIGWTKPALAVTKPFDGHPASPGNGAMVAIVLDARDKVDALHARALALGGKDEGAPGLRGPEGDQAFYAAYARDLDGNKLCFFRVGPAS